jgi:DNA-binding transcriptional regulator YiaG
LNRKDSLLREFAFTEDEAREFIKTKAKIENIQTLDDEIKAIREALDLPEK